MFDTKKFGIFLARQRKNADLTQSELAEKLNLTRQAISKYELGDSFPDISILIQIAEILASCKMNCPMKKKDPKGSKPAKL